MSFIAGPVFGNMNQFTGLGVFVDTYPNEDKSHEVCQPCLSAQSMFVTVVTLGCHTSPQGTGSDLTEQL